MASRRRGRHPRRRCQPALRPCAAHGGPRSRSCRVCSRRRLATPSTGGDCHGLVAAAPAHHRGERRRSNALALPLSHSLSRRVDVPRHIARNVRRTSAVLPVSRRQPYRQRGCAGCFGSVYQRTSGAEHDRGRVRQPHDLQRRVWIRRSVVHERRRLPSNAVQLVRHVHLVARHAHRPVGVQVCKVRFAQRCRLERKD